jgi:mRNA-degrading endonuclease toxin of MazEF toxin-antitoxin module
MNTSPWRRLSVCCAETRLGVGPDIDTNVDAARSARATRRLPDAFNAGTKVPVVVPITSGGNFARTAGFAVPLTGAGTKTTGVVRCDQPRALDLAARGGKKLEAVPRAIVDQVLARLSPIFE